MSKREAELEVPNWRDCCETEEHAGAEDFEERAASRLRAGNAANGAALKRDVEATGSVEASFLMDLDMAARVSQS